MKLCKNGHERTPESVYSSNGGCKACAVAKSAARYAAKKDEINAARHTGPRPSVPPETIRANANARSRRFTKRHPERRTAHHRRKRFGVTAGMYAEMLSAQGAKCAICRQPETALQFGKIRSMSIDHCHDTGRVRGLLCHRCNVALGLFADSPERLRGAAEYLERTYGRATVHDAA